MFATLGFDFFVDSEISVTAGIVVYYDYDSEENYLRAKVMINQI